MQNLDRFTYEQKEHFIILVAALVTAAVIVYILWTTLQILHWIGSQALTCCSGVGTAVDIISRILRIATGVAFVAGILWASYFAQSAQWIEVARIIWANPLKIF